MTADRLRLADGGFGPEASREIGLPADGNRPYGPDMLEGAHCSFTCAFQQAAPTVHSLLHHFVDTRPAKRPLEGWLARSGSRQTRELASTPGRSRTRHPHPSVSSCSLVCAKTQPAT